MKKPLEYAKQACDTMMRKFKAEDLPPKGRFHYHQGVFLSGMYKTYLLCKDERYFTYMKTWVDSIIDPEGEIHTFDPTELDDIQPGILLFPLWARTGDTRYKKALDTLLPYVLNFPRNEEGGLWHKGHYPNQMWLDGLYMAGPISAEYSQTFHKPEYLDLVVEQVLLMEKKTRDPKTGLLYHAWDYSKQEDWADKNTGLSPEIWGRAVGWVPVAILDDMDFMDKNDPRYSKIADVALRILDAIVPYQGADGRWYQVIDKPNQAGNWPENSCTCLFVAAISKAIRKGLLNKDQWLPIAQKGFEGTINTLNYENDDLLLGDVCIGTCVGDYKHYCDRPTSTNDLHGMGAFLLMCEEFQQILE